MPYIDRPQGPLMRARAFPPSRRASRGTVLVVALILLLVLTLIGVTAARLQTAQEGMARNDDNHQLALQAAEAALRDGEAMIGLHSEADFLTDNNGLYDLSAELQSSAASSVADTINWSSPGTQTIAYSGASLSSVPTAPANAQIIIESLPPVATPGSPLTCSGYPACAQTQVYRVTAHAEGGDSSSSVTLQSIIAAAPPQ